MKLIILLSILLIFFCIYDFIAYKKISIIYRLYERLFDRWAYQLLYEGTMYEKGKKYPFYTYKAYNKFNTRTKIVIKYKK